MSLLARLAGRAVELGNAPPFLADRRLVSQQGRRLCSARAGWQQRRGAHLPGLAAPGDVPGQQLPHDDALRGELQASCMARWRG